ncbi:MAG: hypothetical protein QHH75_13100 [Bacillota bacterium]|jgi:hypothetical protein|nr:hypothetical protein [Bacillota bacterium]
MLLSWSKGAHGCEKGAFSRRTWNQAAYVVASRLGIKKKHEFVFGGEDVECGRDKNFSKKPKN